MNRIYAQRLYRLQQCILERSIRIYRIEKLAQIVVKEKIVGLIIGKTAAPKIRPSTTPNPRPYPRTNPTPSTTSNPRPYPRTNPKIKHYT
ncbi:hypothetical protein AC249_AIPGENE25982 [Exaiptasia diaphana]|nr:hypothetical protein AC249_AIPGENE25982 [Exaiptasia diaphana]